jgi:acyl-CoA synthetase (AMP-forming)/AMP-acid ligase II
MTHRRHSASNALAQPATLVDLLRQRGMQQPDQNAYIFLVDGETTEVSVTYGELDRQARAIGAMLQRLGATGQRVLLLYPSGLEYIAAFFGCLYAGAIAVTAYPPRLNHSLDRLEAIVADARPTVALTTTALLAKTGQWFIQAPTLDTLQWLATDTLADDLEETWQEPVIAGSTLAFLQYTSGSTGTPKGVMLSHTNLLSNVTMLQQASEDTAHAAIVGWLPLYHDMGLIGTILYPLYMGRPCVLMSPMAFLQRPLRWLQAVSRSRASISVGPNFAYDLCTRKITPEQRATLDLSCWEMAFNGAEPIRPETLERFARTFAPCGFRRAAFYPCYGLAEATLIVSGGQQTALPVIHTVQKAALGQQQTAIPDVSNDGTKSLVGCGQALVAQQQIRIVDPASHTLCPPDQIGEIWVAGPSVAQGYWNRSEETAQTFRAYIAETGEGPFLRTGDLGFLHHGELFVTGRSKDVIIIRGTNHYPQDIELTVEQCHPSLRPGCGAAFAIEVVGEERLVVVHEVERRAQPARQHHPGRPQMDITPGFEPEPPEPVELDTLIGLMRQTVAEQHGVQVYAIVLLKAGSIAKTSSGKIQRYASRVGFLTQTLDVVDKWQATLTPESESPETMPTSGRADQPTGDSKKQLLRALLSRSSKRVSLNDHAA